MSVCPQALQEEALPSARNTLPSCPSIPPDSPVLGLWGSDQSLSPPARVPSTWPSRSVSWVRNREGWLCWWFPTHACPWVTPGLQAIPQPPR